MVNMVQSENVYMSVRERGMERVGGGGWKLAEGGGKKEEMEGN